MRFSELVLANNPQSIIAFSQGVISREEVAVFGVSALDNKPPQNEVALNMYSSVPRTVSPLSASTSVVPHDAWPDGSQ